jgi:septum formation protein
MPHFGSPVTSRLILASSSPYRQELLRKLRLDFEAVSPAIEETALPNEPPAGLAIRLAAEKASAVARGLADGLIIGSDQVAVLEGRRLSKPLTRENAIAQLRRASGKSVEFFTGVCVLNAANGELKSDLDRCSVVFRKLADAQIERYIDLDRPFDCASGFKSEGLGIALLERFAGEDPNALVGLPLIRLIRLLEAFNVTAI